MKIKKAKAACHAYERFTRNPFALHAKQRKHGVEKPQRGRGSYKRKDKKNNKLDIWV
jgi:hypothetical protein